VARAKAHPLVGTVIQSVEQMPDSEMAERGWHTKPAVIHLKRPLPYKKHEMLRLFPSADPEGNDGGTIFGVDKGGAFYVTGEAVDQEALRGLVILSVTPMGRQELEEMDWYASPGRSAPTVLGISDGSRLFVSRDPEGNGPGVWVVESPAGEELL
jgi:hypothetical protein